jgi:hypothetical protein
MRELVVINGTFKVKRASEKGQKEEGPNVYILLVPLTA